MRWLLDRLRQNRLTYLKLPDFDELFAELLRHQRWQEMDAETAQQHKNQIKEIITNIECPNDFKCCKAGLENLCKADAAAGVKPIECLDPAAQQCDFLTSSCSGLLCKCPLRGYIAKNFHS